jgi:dipeptidyl aminopeptidase
MARRDEEAAQLLPIEQDEPRRKSDESVSEASTTSLVFERIGERAEANGNLLNAHNKMVTPKYPSRGDSIPYADNSRSEISLEEEEKEDDLETGPFINNGGGRDVDKRFRRLIWIVAGVFIGAWVVALVLFLWSQSYKHSSATPHDPAATASRGSGKKITLDQVMNGQWRASKQSISWIEGANGEDGLLLEQGVPGKDYLIVEDVRTKKGDSSALATTTLMKQGYFKFGNEGFTPNKVFPSKDLKKVRVATNVQSNWRHSFIAKYWVFDVATQTAEPLDPANKDGRVQLASWSPQSDAIVFTRDNNLFLRKLSSKTVTQITTDGGPNYFYGVPSDK